MVDLREALGQSGRSQGFLARELWGSWAPPKEKLLPHAVELCHWLEKVGNFPEVLEVRVRR